MKDMTLKDIQSFSLDILDDVHRFCVQHGILYSLAYGTLIGAIRHKGFIPWDDDIDIVMPRPDYDRFCSLYNSDRYHLAIPGQSYLAFSRVYDTDVTFVKQLEMPWHPDDTGVWIDVFPLDAVSDSLDEFMSEARKLDRLWNNQLLWRYTINPFDKTGMMKIAKCLIKRILFRKDIVNILGEHDRIMRQYPFGTTSHLGQLSCPDNIYKEYFPSEIANQYIKVSFEDREFFAFKEYDTFLRCCHGDYMKLPPEQDRKPKQDRKMIFYWK